MHRLLSLVPRPLAAAVLAASCWIWVGAAAGASPVEGDLDGNGVVDAADEGLLQGLYGAAVAHPTYDPAADLNGDGIVDVLDLARFGAGFGQTGAADATAPALLVTLNDVPDDMNDLLVVPPSGFQITLLFDASGGSLLDPPSLSVVADQDVAGIAAGNELAGLFAVTPTRAVFELPGSSPLPLQNVVLDVAVSDLAGNPAVSQYGFAVRPFAFGPPLGNPQVVFLDFDQDRSGAPELDFLEDLREFGLSSAAAPAVESVMRDRLVTEILERTRPYFGLAPDGTPGPDAVNVALTATDPGAPRARMCIGGVSALGANFLGATTLDVNNLDEDQDECGSTPNFGVFPQAMDNLWGGNAEFQATFDPVDPGSGGTPVGEHPDDAVVTDPLFDPVQGTASQVARWMAIEKAVDGFAQAIATVTAHELGHGFGLVAHGAAPAGLWGGTYGAKTDHNVTVTGSVPVPNFLMNQGGSFTFEEMTGRNGSPLPVFRPLAWAYLRDRVALNSSVTGLFPPPDLTSVTPNPVSYSGQTASVTFVGDGFLATPSAPIIELVTEGDPTPNPVLNVMVLDPQTITGVLNKFLVPAATYDVHLLNPDGQSTVLVDGLVVQ